LASSRISRIRAILSSFHYWDNDRPNVSALISAIANGDLVIGEASQREKIEAQMKRLEDQLKELS
jgi:hypothetical protein